MNTKKCPIITCPENIKEKESKFTKSRQYRSWDPRKEYHRCCFLLKNGNRCNKPVVGMLKFIYTDYLPTNKKYDKIFRESRNNIRKILAPDIVSFSDFHTKLIPVKYTNEKRGGWKNSDKNYMDTFVTQCKEHDQICNPKYIEYKLDCDKINDSLGNEYRKFIKDGTVCKHTNLSKKKIIKLLHSCKNKRREFSDSCACGCIKDPGSKKSFIHARGPECTHQHEIKLMKKNIKQCKKQNWKKTKKRLK